LSADGFFEHGTVRVTQKRWTALHSRPQGATITGVQAAGARQRAPRLSYRPGLDGTRAIAVAGVVLYHAGVSWMPGGFLGVDVFFVLSGYLITSLLLAEREGSAEHRIDLRRFWAGRARRLLPALALVVLFSLIAVSTIARDDLARTRGDAVASLVFMTNWHEIAASHSYFDAFGRPSLLQHLWTLAVEEQFYLIWPLLLVGGLKWLGRGRMFALTALGALASTATMWALYDPNQDPSRVYYGTDTRSSTLLVGALLAFAWPAARARAEVSPRARHVLDTIGVAALLGVLVAYWRASDYEPWLYRGGFLLVAIGAAALVGVVSHPASRLGDVLGREPLRWIGKRSYGIYLWHWPIMELTRPRVDVPWHGPLLVIAQIAATVAAAALSYRYVEMPVRTGAAQRKVRAWLDERTPRQRLGWAAAAIGTLALTLGLTLGLPAPSSGPTQLATAAALERGDGLTSTLREGGDPAGRGYASSPTGGLGSASGDPAAGGGGAAAAAGDGKVPPGPILALGDSVMLGSAPVLEERLGSRLRVDAVVGRQAEATIQRIAEYRAEGALPQTVIVQIGDNGPVWSENLQRLREVLRGVAHVVIVNVRVDRDWQNEVDKALAAFVPTWPQAVLANWYAHSSESMLVDGVHPSVAGRAVYAQVIVEALRQLGAR
jgi:peptidoglycan/LPS O-acetylase OafA/YrhL